jgi:hypothetical protein
MAADDYTPPQNNRGEHVLKFATLEGMFYLSSSIPTHDIRINEFPEI